MADSEPAVYSAPVSSGLLASAAQVVRPNTKLIALLAEAQLKAGDTEAASASIERGLAKDPANAALRSVKVRADALKSKR